MRAVLARPGETAGACTGSPASSARPRRRATRATIAVAFFVPAIVYLADAIGTQTEAIAVRRLSAVATAIFTAGTMAAARSPP